MAGKEARLQAHCVRFYRNDWYQNQDGLWSSNNEGRDVNTKLSMGMRPGVSDLCLKDDRGLGGIEFKYPGETHPVSHIRRQCEWILAVCDFGGFCDNLDQFKRIVYGEPAWYDPRKVLVYLATLKTKSFIWDSAKFL